MILTFDRVVFSMGINVCQARSELSLKYFSEKAHCRYPKYKTVRSACDVLVVKNSKGEQGTS